MVLKNQTAASTRHSFSTHVCKHSPTHSPESPKSLILEWIIRHVRRLHRADFWGEVTKGNILGAVLL